MAGFLYTGIATADTVVAVVTAGAGQGAGPLRRVIHEAYLDVLYMSSDPDPDLLAAKTILSDFQDSVRMVADYRIVVADHPEATLPPVPSSWGFVDRPIGELLQSLDRDSASHGGSADLFTRAQLALDSHPRVWHWSGLSRRNMVNTLVARQKLSAKGAFMALGLTKIYNAGAHPRPAWADLPLPDEGLALEVPLRADERDLSQLATSACQFLSGVTTEVAAFFAAASAV